MLNTGEAEVTIPPTIDGPMPLDQIQRAVTGLLSDVDAGPVKVVDLLLAQAVAHDASDIHFEPWLERMAIRFRLDGLLHDVAALPKSSQDRVVARLKVLARVVVYQKELPQDGRIEAPDGHGAAMRVATYPTVNGEKVVVRLLSRAYRPMALDTLGFRGDVTNALRRVIARPQGTLLLTGPSSSGKTTTIYALLQEILDRPGSAPHVVSIEDPVEHRLDRIAQTEIRPHAGFTYEAALRAVLRQDPEVIVIGEIRDPETARLAVQAGLTGHLVISTIHSGTAVGVFARLLDMGIEPFLIASSLTGVLAQRLVRLNCMACREPYVPAPDVLSPVPAGTPLMRGRGCPACQGIGYRGRAPLAEWLMMTDGVAELVLNRSRTRVLHEAAVAQGLVTLHSDGLSKAAAGLTTAEELRRVLPPLDQSESEQEKAGHETQ